MRIFLSILCISLSTSCTKTKEESSDVRQSFNVDADLIGSFKSTDLGAPFNSQNHTRPSLDNCLVLKEVVPNIQDKNETSFSLQLVHNKSELNESLDLGGEGQLNLAKGKLDSSIRAKYARSAQFNRTTTFIVIKLNVINKVITTEEANYDYSESVAPRIQRYLSGTQNLGIKRSVKKAFMKECGDSFLISYAVGGSFYGVIKIESESLFTKKQLDTQIKVGMKNTKFVPNETNSIDSTFGYLNQITSQYNSVEITSFQLGGRSATDTSPAKSLNEMAQRIKSLSISFSDPETDTPVSFSFKEYSSRFISKIPYLDGEKKRHTFIPYDYSKVRTYRRYVQRHLINKLENYRRYLAQLDYFLNNEDEYVTEELSSNWARLYPNKREQFQKTISIYESLIASCNEEDSKCHHPVDLRLIGKLPIPRLRNSLREVKARRRLKNRIHKRIYGDIKVEQGEACEQSLREIKNVEDDYKCHTRICLYYDKFQNILTDLEMEDAEGLEGLTYETLLENDSVSGLSLNCLDGWIRTYSK